MNKTKDLMPTKYLQVRGAREHNLKNIDIDLPKNKLIVITVYLVQEKFAVLIQYMLKVKEDMWNLFSICKTIFTNDAKPDVDLLEGYHRYIN